MLNVESRNGHRRGNSAFASVTSDKVPRSETAQGFLEKRKSAQANSKTRRPTSTFEMNDRASRPPSNTSAQNSQFKRPKSKIDVASIVNKVEE